MTYFSVELVSEVDHLHFVVVLLFRRNNKSRAKRLQLRFVASIHIGYAPHFLLNVVLEKLEKYCISRLSGIKGNWCM